MEEALNTISYITCMNKQTGVRIRRAQLFCPVIIRKNSFSTPLHNWTAWIQIVFLYNKMNKLSLALIGDWKNNEWKVLDVSKTKHLIDLFSPLSAKV